MRQQEWAERLGGDGRVIGVGEAERRCPRSGRCQRWVFADCRHGSDAESLFDWLWELGYRRLAPRSPASFWLAPVRESDE